MKKAFFHSKSISKKIIISMIAMLMVEVLLFLIIIIYGGTVEQLNQNAFDILNQRVITRKNYLQNDMLQRWSNIEDSVQSIDNIIENTMRETGASYEDLSHNQELYSLVLSRVSDSVVYMLRKHSVTGAFVILHGKEDPQAEEIQKPGLYIRDLDPETYPNDDSDLMLERSPSSITRESGLTMDTGWTPLFTFRRSDQESDNPGAYDFYYQPYQAAVEHPEIGMMDLGYWSQLFTLSADDRQVITYSVPLLASDGTVYGVTGIEISLDYLQKQLPYDELLSDKQGSYLLALNTGADLSFTRILSSGPAFTQLFGTQKQIDFHPKALYSSCYSAIKNERLTVPVYGCIQYINMYNSNTPFESQRWALIGIAEEAKLFSFSSNVEITVLTAAVLSLVIGTIFVFSLGIVFTKPISQLVKLVKESNPRNPVKFGKTNIYEIDELASAIEALSANVADSASKLSQIIDMASIPISAFEYLADTNEVYHTRRFFEILQLSGETTQDSYIPADSFQQLMSSISPYIVENDKESGTIIYHLRHDSKYSRWVRLRYLEQNKRVLGVAEDITQETLEKKKIEYERDYDLLTSLLNRRAFHSILSSLFQEPEHLKTAALLMFDLDNLKYINDTYGHDLGDQYIRQMATTLQKSAPPHTILSRMSGDEFYVFIYGYKEKAEIRKEIEHLQSNITSTQFDLPDDTSMRLRASGGIAWYPDDSTSYEELIRYADFAMYRIKNTIKGEINEFDLESYREESYLLHGKEDLNQLIDFELIEYHFQPIVDAKTGEIFAYEALMRSQMSSLKTPAQILTLARSQSKLYQIERLTWFRALKDYSQYTHLPEDYRLFINSISNQALTPQDIDLLEKEYASLLPRVVVEFTEEEKLDEKFLKEKRFCLNRWKSKLALDDFGTGYNGERMLLELHPNYIKIDMSIIRDIHLDKSRQKILQNLLTYSHERHIQVIAEGVESKEEMAYLIRSGIDYLQGYYIGIPQKNPQTINRHLAEEIRRENLKI